MPIILWLLGAGFFLAATPADGFGSPKASSHERTRRRGKSFAVGLPRYGHDQFGTGVRRRTAMSPNCCVKACTMRMQIARRRARVGISDGRPSPSSRTTSSMELPRLRASAKPGFFQPAARDRRV